MLCRLVYINLYYNGVDTFCYRFLLQSGATVGWRVDASGNLQTVFTHELKDPLVQVVYRVHTNTDKNIPTLDIK